MLISVIIPNYNHSKFLQTRFDSILNQTYQNIELIILDDASTDESVALISKIKNNYSKVSYFVVNRNNSGSTFKQWEKGIKLAKGELIWIAESDDFADLNFLQIAVDKFQKYSINLFFCNSWVVNGSNQIIGKELEGIHFTKDFLIDGYSFIQNHMILDNSIYNASSVVFKNPLLLNEKLYLRSDFKLCADHLFWITLIKDQKIYFSGEVFNFFRRLDSGVTNIVGKVNSINERIEVSKFLFSINSNFVYLKKRNSDLTYIVIGSSLSLKNKIHLLTEIKKMESFLNFVNILCRSYFVLIYNRIFLR